MNDTAIAIVSAFVIGITAVTAVIAVIAMSACGPSGVAIHGVRTTHWTRRPC